jgi:hypothetical protein
MNQEPLAKVEERECGKQKVFVVTLSADAESREKDLRSFYVEYGERHDPMRQKAVRFAERVNSAAESWCAARVDEALEQAALITETCGKHDDCPRCASSIRALKSGGARRA